MERDEQEIQEHAHLRERNQILRNEIRKSATKSVIERGLTEIITYRSNEGNPNFYT